MLGFDDRHLDFRIVVDLEEQECRQLVSVTTLVRRKNLFGRLYLLPSDRFTAVSCRRPCGRSAPMSGLSAPRLRGSVDPRQGEALCAQQFDKAFLAGQMQCADGHEDIALGKLGGGPVGHDVIAVGDDTLFEGGVALFAFYRCLLGSMLFSMGMVMPISPAT